jgi:hypothetical protein
MATLKTGMEFPKTAEEADDSYCALNAKRSRMRNLAIKIPPWFFARQFSFGSLAAPAEGGDRNLLAHVSALEMNL